MSLDWKLCTLMRRRKADLEGLMRDVPPQFQPEGPPPKTVKEMVTWLNAARANYWDAKQEEVIEANRARARGRPAPRARQKPKPRSGTAGGNITASQVNAFLASLDASPDGVERGQGQDEQE